MKWLWYVAGALLAVVILAVVGLLVLARGESRLDASVDVARPPDVVFTWISEPQHIQKWLGWLVEIRPLTPESDRAGARQVWVMEDRNNNNQRMEIHTEYVAYQPPNALTASLRVPEGFSGTVEYRLEPLDGGRTRLHYVGSYQFDHWLAKLLEPVITRSAQQKLEEDLARLKQQAEAVERARDHSSTATVK
jgi:uncharacterized protein YndB with AHSA1/START domain